MKIEIEEKVKKKFRKQFKKWKKLKNVTIFFKYQKISYKKVEKEVEKKF